MPEEVYKHLETEAPEARPDARELLREVRGLLEEHQASLQRRFDALMLRQEEVVGGLMRLQPDRSSVASRRSGGRGPLQPPEFTGRSCSSLGKTLVPSKRPSVQEGSIFGVDAVSNGEPGLLTRSYMRRSARAATEGSPGRAIAGLCMPQSIDHELKSSVRRHELLHALGVNEDDGDNEPLAMHQVSSLQRGYSLQKGLTKSQSRLDDQSRLAPADLFTARQRKEGFWTRWRHKLTNSTREGWFDFVCGVMVLSNAVLIGVETEFTTYNRGMSHPAFVLAQLSLNLWFTCELLVRVYRDDFRFFSSSEWKWNIFDAVLVGLSLADVIQLAQTGLDHGVIAGGRLMRIIRLARVVRTLRLMRSLNYIHQFRKMVYSLSASISTLVWSLLLLVAVMYAFAVLFVQGVAEHMHLQQQDFSPDSGMLFTEYGSILRALVTLYKAISNGVSWGIVMEPLTEVDPSFAVLFIAYVSIVFFGVLNVVSAVFVESAMASAAHYKDLRIYESRKAKAELVRHMREVFKQIDEDESGAISFEEMDRFLSDPQLKNYVESLEVTVEDTAMLFQLMDLDDSGVVDIDEFCSGLLRLQGDARSFDMHLLIFEMSKFHKQWDKFINYVDFMFGEVIDVIGRQEMERQVHSVRLSQALVSHRRCSRASAMSGANEGPACLPEMKAPRPCRPQERPSSEPRSLIEGACLCTPTLAKKQRPLVKLTAEPVRPPGRP